jgi:purine catabolism regulator
MLRVRDLMREFELRALAGHDGLDASIRGVQTSDLLDPTPWLSPGELLLTTARQLDGDASQREFVGRLARLGLVGLGVGTTLVPAEHLIDAADSHGLPVLEIPDTVPFIAITHAASDRIAGDDQDVMLRALEAHEALEQSMAAKPGLATLVEALSGLLDAAVIVFDGAGNQLVRRDLETPPEARILSALANEIQRARRQDGRTPSISFDGHGVRCLGLPVSAARSGEEGRTADAWLVAVKDNGGLSSAEEVLLRQAAPLAALELLRRRMADAGKRRAAGDVLAAIVGGELAGDELRRRLEPLGLSDTAAAIVIQRPADERFSSLHIEAALAAALRRESAPGLVASTGPLTCALVPGLPNEPLFALAARVSTSVSADLATPVEVGAGRAVSVGSVRQSFDEARSALDARSVSRADAPVSEAAGGGPVATFRDLGSYQLLLSLQGEDALRLFCESILGPIEAMESSYGGELLKSLQVFIECNGQWERAARQLFCHRHTLRYRIRKIEELTDRDLERATDRIEFYLALRARGLLS